MQHRLAAVALTVLTATLTPALAGAQGAGTPLDPQAATRSDCARARAQGKTCELNMEAESIERGPGAGDGIAIVIREQVKHSSLIRVRREWLAEILAAAEQLD